jgi:predicted phosphodiesterase
MERSAHGSWIVRYAVVSDIHANWQAWTAVRDDFLSAGVDVVVCLGDVVGYGPHPARVLRDVRSCCSNFVLGNHDAAMVGRVDIGRFRAGARRSSEWTRARMDAKALSHFSATPLMMEGEGALFVHAETPAPEDYGYVEEPDDALACFQAADARFIFLGHTHVPGSFILGPDGCAVADLRSEFAAEGSSRYLVNVGSVGDPRNGTDRAGYAIYDSATGRVELRQIAFDTEAFLAAVRKRPELELPYFCCVREQGGPSGSKDEAMTATKVALVKVQRIVDRPRIRVRRSALEGRAAASDPGADAPASAEAEPPRRRRRAPAVYVAAALVAAGVIGFGADRIVRARRSRVATAPAMAAAAAAPAPAAPSEPVVAEAHRGSAARELAEALSVITLTIAKAEKYGTKFRVEMVDGVPTMGFWSDPSDYLLWRLHPREEAVYEVGFDCGVAPDNAGGCMLVAVGRERVRATMASTGSWHAYTNVTIGRIRLPAGLAILEVRPDGKPRGGVINLRGVTLRPVRDDAAASPAPGST